MVVKAVIGYSDSKLCCQTSTFSKRTCCNMHSFTLWTFFYRISSK